MVFHILTQIVPLCVRLARGRLKDDVAFVPRLVLAQPLVAERHQGGVVNVIVAVVLPHVLQLLARLYVLDREYLSLRHVRDMGRPLRKAVKDVGRVDLSKVSDAKVAIARCENKNTYDGGIALLCLLAQVV